MPTDAESFASLRADAIAALADDQANPKPDYSLDGQSVSRAAWRKGQMDLIEWTYRMEVLSDPYEIRSSVL